MYSSVWRTAMLHELETVAVTKKPIEAMEVAEIENIEVFYGSDEKR